MASLTVPVGGEELAAFFLDGLRKDAFLMEWGAYRKPVLPKKNEFPSVFASFWERVQTLLKWPAEPSLVCIAQAKYPDSSYESLVCVQSSALAQERVFHQWKPKQPLAIHSIRQPLEFANQVLLEQAAIAKPIGHLAADSIVDVAVARYFVRPVLDERTRHKSSDLVALLTLEPIARKKGFVHTESFMSSRSHDLGEFDYAYYSSVLGLALPSECVFSDEYLRWLEVLHVSFQLSWGFPLLTQKREELAKQQEQASHLEEIRTVARELSETIERHVIGSAHRLLSLLDPSTMLDNRRVSAMFDTVEMNKGRVFWSGKDIHDRIIALHDPIAGDDATNRRFVALAIHFILGTPDLHTLRTADEVVAAAKSVVEKPKTETGLMRLLAEALEHPFEGFNLLKEIWFAPMDTGREVSLIALAVRFVLAGGVHNPDFRALVSDELGNELTLTRSNLCHEQLFQEDSRKERPWYDTPKTKGVRGVGAIEWIQPFSALITNGLQRLSEGHGVYVSTVKLVGTEDGCDISCDITEVITGRLDEIVRLSDDILHRTPGECNAHNLRGPLREFRDRISKADLAPRMKFSWSDSPKMLMLKLR